SAISASIWACVSACLALMVRDLPVLLWVLPCQRCVTRAVVLLHDSRSRLLRPQPEIGSGRD
uniref:hypothetical protein n=1 Tax=Nocardioides psychrotolerans TaxID=1005945 RepID=UPI003137F792